MKFPTKFRIQLFVLIFTSFLLLSCTRSYNPPARMTEQAIRFEITKIGLQTAAPTLAYRDELIARAKTAANNAPVEIIPLDIQQQLTATEANPVVAIEVVATATKSPPPTAVPTLRNTFPVEQINPDPLYQPEPTATQQMPVVAEDYVVTPMPPIAYVPTAVPTELPDLVSPGSNRVLYVTQNGDTLYNLSTRFAVNMAQITSMQNLPTVGYLDKDITLFINAPSNRMVSTPIKIIPDEFVVFSDTASEYDLFYEIEQANGYLASYQEETSDGLKSGKDIIYKVCRDYSINPIVLLALLEYKSHWVYGYPQTAVELDYPMGWMDSSRKGLQKQLNWAVETLSAGYYGWRNGELSEIPFYRYPRPTQPIYFNPGLNAGSVAIQYLFSQIYNWDVFEAAIYGEDGFYSSFIAMFGNVWEHFEGKAEGLNASLKQVDMTLPFSPNERWALTGGPHEAWSKGTPFASLDFAPPSASAGCTESYLWVLSTTPGKVVRVGNGMVLVDVDGDGSEETGWVILYLHIATKGKIALGSTVEVGTRLGHPSCEGGSATGTHVHIARKYNGEWISATGALPFVMNGWVPFQGAKAYLGGMTRGSEIVQASTVASQESLVAY